MVPDLGNSIDQLGILGRSEVTVNGTFHEALKQDCVEQQVVIHKWTPEMCK